MDSGGLTVDCNGKSIAFGNYYPVTQCGGNCCRNNCFGGKTDYIERASTNRFDGPNPLTRGGLSCQSTYAQCKGQNPQRCFRVAPNTYMMGETSYYMNKMGDFAAYDKGYDILRPSFVSNGIACDVYPILNDAAVQPLTHYSKL